MEHGLTETNMAHFHVFYRESDEEFAKALTERIEETGYPRLGELIGETDGVAFADKGGYTYGGIYVRYLIELVGMEKFLSVYKGECDAEELLEDSFESRAIAFCKSRFLRERMIQAAGE